MQQDHPDVTAEFVEELEDVIRDVEGNNGDHGQRTYQEAIECLGNFRQQLRSYQAQSPTRTLGW